MAILCAQSVEFEPRLVDDDQLLWISLTITRLFSMCEWVFAAGLSAPRGLGAVPPPHILANKLTYSNHKSQIVPTTLKLAPTNFQTFLRPCQHLQPKLDQLMHSAIIFYLKMTFFIKIMPPTAHIHITCLLVDLLDPEVEKYWFTRFL